MQVVKQLTHLLLGAGIERRAGQIPRAAHPGTPGIRREWAVHWSELIGIHRRPMMPHRSPRRLLPATRRHSGRPFETPESEYASRRRLHLHLDSLREHPMTRSPQCPRDPEQRRTRIALALITGALAGATRALAGWLLDHLTNAN
ncbi:hypothetical protein Are01nite_61610 [Actinoplanes regularis]|nr:hypothetical protein Are01nite_61610 [Actinoplanes regularis]